MPTVPKRRAPRAATRLAWLLLSLATACSQQSSPTGPGPLPTPTPPGGGQTGQPVILDPSNHPEGWARSQCLVCHQPGLLPYHDDLTEDQCVGCHGDNGTDPDYEPCVVCHGNPPATGAHELHLDLDGMGVDCDTCHAGAGLARADRHRDGQVQVQLSSRFGGAYASGRCSNTFCHGSGTPVWTSLDLACSECHHPSGSADIDPKSGQHPSHAARGFDCDTCHASAPSSHYNAVIDNPDGVRPDGGHYTDTTPEGYNPSGSSGSCGGLGVGCHGFTSQWTNTDTCGACHAIPPPSGSHRPHAASSGLGYPCTYCHNLYPANHANFQVDVVFDSRALPGNGSFSRGTCSDVYCHGAGSNPLPPAGGASTTPTWGGSPPACGDCHGAPGGAEAYPPSGKHQEHVDWFGFDCEECHSAFPEGHVDGQRTMVFSDSFPEASFERAPVPNEGTCRSVACHAGFPSDERSWRN